MQNKKILALFILIFSTVFTSQLFPQKINKLYVVKNSAKFSPGDIVSPDIRDVNGDVAAALIIETDLEGLSFEANNGIVKLIHNQPGEYMLLLQPSERVVNVYAPKYQPLQIILYNYDIMLESGRAWRIKITGDKQLDKIPISILTNVKGTKVFIDNKYEGNGNAFKVPAGKHKIRIEKEGYRTIEKEINVTEDNILFNYTLQSIDPVAVNINSTPQGATVFVNEDEKGKTPLAKFLYPGKYKIRLNLSGYLPINEEITVTDNGSNEFNYNLTKDISYLTLDVTPTDAEVRINDRITKTGNLELLPGNYIIRISKSKYIPIIDTVNLKLGEKIHKKYSLAKNVGYLTLNVTPADAEILINKEDYSGRTEIELAPGTYKIEVKKEGYYGKEEVLNVELGKTIRKQYTLEPKVGTLQFSISPPNANVKLIRNGEVINNWKGLKIVKNLLVGKYEIEAKANGYKTYRKKFEIRENEIKKIEAELTPGSDFGLLVFESPNACEIYIDDKKVDNINGKINIAPGLHKIRLKKNGDTYMDYVEVKPGNRYLIKTKKEKNVLAAIFSPFLPMTVTSLRDKVPPTFSSKFGHFLLSLGFDALNWYQYIYFYNHPKSLNYFTGLFLYAGVAVHLMAIYTSFFVPQPVLYISLVPMGYGYLRKREFWQNVTFNISFRIPL